VSKKRIHNKWLLGTLGWSFATGACSFATSFDDLSSDGPTNSIAEGGDATPGDSESDAEVALHDAASGDATPSEYMPAEGDYTYGASGTESVHVENFFFGTAESGPRPENGTFTARITHTDDRHWKFSAAISVMHADDFLFEAKDLALYESAGSQFTAWDLPNNPNLSHVELLTQWACDPPNLMLTRSAEGGLFPTTQTCTARTLNKDANFVSFTLSGVHTFIGEEEIVVDGVSVPCLHFLQSRNAIGGGISGDAPVSTLAFDWYFRKTDGLPIKQFRKTVLRQWVIGAKADLTENAGWQITSLTPKPLPPADAGNADADSPSDSGIKDAIAGQ